MAKIHPTALVESCVEMDADVIIGAYSIVKGPVSIGAGTIIHEHTHLQGKTRVGARCKIGPAAYVGLPPQHLKADPEIGELIVGDDVTIRETASIHRATHGGSEHATRIGDHCFLMGGVHVGHDCVLGDSVIIANSALLGGHCQIGDHAFIGGGAALHQFVRVGRLAIIGGNETVTQEVLPFAAIRDRGMRGYNAIGCRRAGMNRQTVSAIRAVFRSLHSHRLTEHAIDEIRLTVPDLPEVRELLDFIATTKRGIVPSTGGRRRVFDEVAD
jgi:UDP-N-acetylglucosamine acyltransferase